MLNPEHAKPHPKMIQVILEELNVKPDEAVMVGDSESDVQMAEGAGVEAIVVLTGYLNEAQARELGVEQIIQDVTQLESVIEV